MGIVDDDGTERSKGPHKNADPAADRVRAYTAGILDHVAGGKNIDSRSVTEDAPVIGQGMASRTGAGLDTGPRIGNYRPVIGDARVVGIYPNRFNIGRHRPSGVVG